VRRMIEQTSKEAEPDKDEKLNQITEINIALSLFGALSMRQISDNTNIPYTSVTWRFYDDRASDEPMWVQVGTFPIKGRRFKIFDLIRQNEWIEKEIINKEFYEYLVEQEVQKNMTGERFNSYREKCPECNEEVWVQKSKGGNLYYTQNDWKGKDYKERPNWHSEYCRGRPKEPLKEETAPPKEEPKRSVLGTVFPKGEAQFAPEDPGKTKQVDLPPTDTSFKVGSIPLSDEEKITVERSLVEDISRSIVNYVRFRIEQEIEKVK